MVRVTEAAALAAGRWMGRGQPDDADHAAGHAMAEAINILDMDGHIVVGEEGKLGRRSRLDSGEQVGNGRGPAMDVVVDPLDGRKRLALGYSDAISVVGVAPRHSMWSPRPAVYMEKIVVDRTVGSALVPECMDAPAAWTLGLVARVKGKSVRDLVVFVLDRPRHHDLIDEIRAAGARILLRSDGDIAGALMASLPDNDVDLLMGVGGVSEGVVAACAVKAVGGSMIGRLAPQSQAELDQCLAEGLDQSLVLTCDELIRTDEIYFAATGITDGRLMIGVRYKGDEAETDSMVLRAQTGTRRIVHATHRIGE